MSFSEGNILKPFGESSNKQASVFDWNVNSGYMINCDVFQFFPGISIITFRYI